MGINQAQATLSNLIWDISLIPIRMEIDYKARKYRRNQEIQKKKDEGFAQSKTEERKIVKEAKKAANADKNDDYSDGVRNNIEVISGEDALKKINLIGRATETNKLIQYAMFYMTDERAKLISHNQIEKEIINAIAEIYDFGKIYDSALCADLRKYDFDFKDDYISTSKYLLSIKDLENKKNDQSFMEKMRLRKEQILAESKPKQEEEKPEEPVEPANTYFSTKWVQGDDGFVRPIFFNSEEKNVNPVNIEATINKKGIGISDELFSKLERVFEPIMGNRKYRYEMNNDLVSLFVSRDNGIEEYYVVDPGLVMGLGKIYILARIMNGDTLFVPVEPSFSDIVANIINSAFYVLNADEQQRVLYPYFRNMGIYRYIDMQGTEKFADLSIEDFQKLGKKLTFILNQVSNQSSGNCDIPRFRFNRFENIDDFIIISDYSIKSPMSIDGTTSNTVVEGLMFVVNGDNITQRLRDSVIEFHIDKYGNM